MSISIIGAILYFQVQNPKTKPELPSIKGNKTRNECFAIIRMKAAIPKGTRAQESFTIIQIK